MNEEIQKGHQVAADFHEDSSDSGKILTRRNKDLLLPHCGLLFFFFKFSWNFILCNTLGVQFLIKFIRSSGEECITFFEGFFVSVFNKLTN